VGENQETGTPSVKRCILWIINHPNPFNPLTQVSFELNSFQSSAALQVFTMEGALVKTLYAGSLEKGVHSFMWDGKNSVGINIASGVYLYVLSTEKEKISKKMILLK
jgi:flagellar hook assembly protein FlgD